MQHTIRDSTLTQITHDACLPDEIRPVRPSASPRHPIKHAFITGATGFLGRYVVKALLQHTGLQLTCLIRADHFDKARQRLNHALEQAGIARVADADSKVKARIAVVCGDLTQPQLGLSTDAYQQLAQSVDTLYHCAALVNWARSYRKLRSINVLGTLAMIRFACHAHPKPLLFVSSIAVCYATNREEAVNELTDMLPHIAHMPLGYAQSKCVAESLLRQVAQRGLPVTILRPALISGDTESGVSNTEDFVAALLDGCVRSGMAMDTDWQLDFVPVDVVALIMARFIAHWPASNTAPSRQPTILHLVADRPRYWRELILWLNLYGYPISLVRPEQWLKQIFKNQQHCGKRLYNYRRFFQGLPGQQAYQAKPYECYLQAGQQRIDSSFSTGVLTTSGLEIPVLDATLLQRYCHYFQRCGLLSKLPAKPDSSPDQKAILTILQLPDAELQAIPLNTDNGILNQIVAAYAGAAIGLRAYRVTDTKTDIVVKTKCADALVEDSTVRIAALCSPKLGRLFQQFRSQLGLAGAQQREAAIYGLTNPVLRRYTPHCFGTQHNTENGLTTIVLEKLAQTVTQPIPQQPGYSHRWAIPQLQTVITGLAHIQTIAPVTLKPLMNKGLLVAEHSTATMLEMSALWHELTNFAAKQSEQAAKLWPLQQQAIATLATWWPQLLAQPQSLIHNDFNPRNLVLRSPDSHHEQAGQLCVFDWELAALGTPQRDLAEFLCFALNTETRDPAIVAELIERHRQRYCTLSGHTVSPASWRWGFSLALQQFVITRLPLYALMQRFRPQAFLSVVNENAYWLLCKS